MRKKHVFYFEAILARKVLGRIVLQFALFCFGLFFVSVSPGRHHRVLEASWAVLEYCSHLGAVWRRLGRLSGAVWAVIAVFDGRLGGVLGLLGNVLRHLADVVRRFGATCGHLRL